MEMEAKEIRIGNIVGLEYTTGVEFCEVKSINSKSVGLLTSVGVLNGFDIVNINPLPLTKKWLIKFGFEEELEVIEGIKSYDYCLKIGNSTIKCGWNYDGTLNYLYLEGFDLAITRVHTLQNLYFALTGEELIIKD